MTEGCVPCSVFGLEIHLFYALGSLDFLAFLFYSYNHLIVFALNSVCVFVPVFLHAHCSTILSEWKSPERHNICSFRTDDSEEGCDYLIRDSTSVSILP